MGDPNPFSFFRALLGQPEPSQGPPGEPLRPMPSHTPGPPPPPGPTRTLPPERYRPDTTMVGVDEDRWEQLRQDIVNRIAMSPYIPEGLKPATAVLMQRGVELPRTIVELLGQPETVTAPPIVTGQALRGAADVALPELARFIADESGALKLPGRGLGRAVDAVDPRSVRSMIEPVRLRDVVKDRFDIFRRLSHELPYRADWRGANSPIIQLAFDYDQPAAERWGSYLASTSPSNMVPGNTKESAASQWFRLRHPGRLFTEADLRNTANPTTYGNPGSKWANLNRSDLGEPLSGDKVNAFRGFNIGSNEAAIDRHILYALGVRPNDPKGTEILLAPELPALKALFEERLGHKISNSDAYELLAGAVSDAVQELNPRAVFQDLYGDVWEGAKYHKGEPFTGGPPDILKRVGLGGRGAMQDVDLLEEVIREGARTPGFWTAKPR